MNDSLKKLRIFVASPSDVTNERAKLETVVDSLKPIADYLGLTLEIIDWRAVVPDAGRPQQVIFDQLKPTSWDIFIGILWHRFGTPPGAKDKTGEDYLSGTEEEFKTAYELWKQHGKPRMVLYRCTRALPFDVDPDQLKNVRAFFKLIEDTKGDYPTLYQAFDTTESFEKLVLNNLQKLLVEYGEESKTPITPEVEQVLAPKIPNNLPRRQAFFGRTKEMDTVMRALGPADRTWGVLVDGIGGIGKSAIAIEAAHLSQEKNLFDAFVFVTAKTNILEPSGIKELNPPARTLDEFLNETARVLGQSGIAKLPGDEKRSALIDVLRSMRTLLIYDNLETLSKEEQEGIADFLRELPQGCKAIITSRRRGGEGAVWLRVEKLDWDAARGIIENQMLLDEGLANKLNRVGEARWQELFDETNGSPLALVHTLGLMRVRAALTFDSAFEMLRGNRDEDLQRFIFQEARKELTENDKTALSALSLFAPSATFEIWIQVVDLSRNALETTIDRLSALSLVDVLVGEERYALHPLTRAFVRNEMLNDVNALHKMEMRFAKIWVDYASRYGGEGKESYKTYSRLKIEWENINLAADWLYVNRGDLVSGKNLSRNLINLQRNMKSFLEYSGLWDEKIRMSVYRYDASCAIEAWRDACWASYDAGWTHCYCNSADDAQIWAERCADAAHKLKDRDQEANALLNELLGLIEMQRMNFGEAEQKLQSSLMIWRQLGIDERNVVEKINLLGELNFRWKRYDNAEKFFEEALEISQQEDLLDYLPYSMNGCGKIKFLYKQFAKARVWFEQAVMHAKGVGRIEAIAQAQYGLALVEEVDLHMDSALGLAKEAVRIFERLQSEELMPARVLVERLEKRIKLEG